jgi:NAD(P) transhydrogenase subunit alpha
LSAIPIPQRDLAADASALFSRNLYNFLSAFWDKEQGQHPLGNLAGAG